MADRLRIRPADPADASALGQIERASFGDPWTDRSIEEALMAPTGIGFVAVLRAGVVGYLLARQVGGSGEILNLAVAPEARRKGVGRALLVEGLHALVGRGVGEVFLEVRESNRAALGLYEREGFRAVGMRKGYYRSPPEDALVLRREFAVSG